MTARSLTESATRPRHIPCDLSLPLAVTEADVSTSVDARKDIFDATCVAAAALALLVYARVVAASAFGHVLFHHLNVLLCDKTFPSRATMIIAGKTYLVNELKQRKTPRAHIKHRGESVRGACMLRRILAVHGADFVYEIQLGT